MVATDAQQTTQGHRINQVLTVLAISGLPLFVLSCLGHHWAEVVVKVLICTVVIFGVLLWVLEREYLDQRWLWLLMIPLILIHFGAMLGLVWLNISFPQMDDFPLFTYPALLPIIVVEGTVFYMLVEKIRRTHRK